MFKWLIFGGYTLFAKCLVATTFGVGVILAANHSPAVGADLGGECCADLEERIAELEVSTLRQPNRSLTLTIEGVVNRAFLNWDDGERRDTYVVDNSQNNSTIFFEGEVELDGGWKAGLTFGLDVQFPSSDSVSQREFGTQEELTDLVDLSDNFVTISHERLGTINFGFTDSAADDIADILLSKSYNVADAETVNWIDNFFLQGANLSGPAGLATGLAEEGLGVAELRWGDFVPGLLGGDSVNGITYISPDMRGFEFSASWGQDDFWDVALRYNGEWAKTFMVEAGIGYWANTTEEFPLRFAPREFREEPLEPVDNKAWGGGIAVRHIPTGLNLAVNYATEEHTDECFEPGIVTGRCRGDDETLYINGGLIRDFTGLGDTAIYGEYNRVRRDFNESDEDTLQALEINEGQAEEVKDSLATVWGVGVVQQIRGQPINEEEPGVLMEFYLGYRRYSLDIDLINEEGAVPSRRINDMDVVLTGATIFF